MTRQVVLVPAILAHSILPVVDLEPTSYRLIVVLFSLIINTCAVHGTAIVYDSLIILIDRNVNLDTYLF